MYIEMEPVERAVSVTIAKKNERTNDPSLTRYSITEGGERKNETMSLLEGASFAERQWPGLPYVRMGADLGQRESIGAHASLLLE
jgi:hypothetical protein